MEAPLVPQVLLQHGQFVRALARSLLRDGHAAEDVAQETWARYFEKRPTEERGLRQWFRVVVRNFAVNRSRAERGRAAREQGAARAEARPSAHEELEHGELLGVVVQAVLALDEPYRSTIVGRYYRGLDAEAIAQKSGTTAATVRSREHRALEKLRERLDRHMADRQCKGERGAWAAVLARFAGPASSFAVPSSAWPVAAKVALPLLVVAAGVTLWLRPPATSEASLAPSTPSVTGNAPSAEPAAPTPLAPAAAPAEMRTALAGSSAGHENAGNASLSEIRGRFVFSGGAPAVGVPIQVHGWGSNQDAVLQYGEPENWVDPQGTTDADGRFALRFEPPRAYQFTLDAKAPGHAQAEWRWGEIAPGATLDLGEVELPVGGTIEGHMVDPQGAPLSGDKWLVYARTAGLGEGDGRDDTQVIAAVDPDTGAFRLQDVWPAQVNLRGYSRMANWIDGPTVAVRSGETATADVVYSGPSNAKRITVVTFSDPFYVMSNPEPEHIRLLGPAGETRTAREIEGSSQSYSFDELAPGTYALEIDDPRYVPWSKSGVTPGQEVNAHLVGNAALRLSVIDAAGQPAERYAVRVTFRNVDFWPREFEVHDGESALAGGLVRGMFPGDYTVAIRCADGTTARDEVDGLQSNETRTMRLELERQLFAAGRVVHNGGEGVADAEVLLLSPAVRGDSDASPILGPNSGTNDEGPYRKQLAAATTDADGAFHLDVPGPGPFLLRASASGALTFSPHFTLDSSRADFELALPRPGSVRGRVRASAGSSFAGLGVWVAPLGLCVSTGADADPLAGMEQVNQISESLKYAVAALSADGAFELAHLPPGPSKAYLVLTELVGHGFSLSANGIAGAVPLGALEIPAGGVLERDFDAQELPGSVTLLLRVNGAPAPFVQVTLTGDETLGWLQLEGRTDAEGRCGPLRAPVGVWSVFALDSGSAWSHHLPTPVVVESGRETHATLDVQVTSGSLLFVDAQGQPLSGESVTLLRASALDPQFGRAWEQVLVRKLDATARLSLQLVPGEYALQRGEFDPWEEPSSPVPLTWTATGPLSERVQL